MEFKKNYGSIARVLFWLALFLPTLLALAQSGGNGRTWQTILWAASACLIPSLLPATLFVVVQWLFLLLIPVLLWWITYAALNGIGPGIEAAIAALSATSSEAWGAILITINAPAALFFSVVCSACLVSSIVMMRKARHSKPSSDSAPTHLKLLLFFAILPFSISFVSNASGLPVPVLFLASDPGYSPLGTATRLIWEGFDEVLYGDIKVIAPERRTATAPRIEHNARLAVFIIGESVRAGGIGPEQINRGAWTKALDVRVQNHLGAWLPTTCSGSNGTAVSVPMLLTGLTPQRYAESGTAPSILAILKVAGYKTAWISNQDKNVFTEHGHDYYWTITHSGSVSDSYDEQLVPIAKTFITPLLLQNDRATTPYAMALHLHGSHFDYAQRYPATDFDAEPKGLSNDALTELRYNRSEEYTAKVINELLRLLDATKAPAFLVYSSDHGENLPSDHNGVLFHLGPRATLKDGTTTSFVMWNQAMAMTGEPTKVLSQIMTMPMIAHADVAKIYLSLAGMYDGAVAPDRDPEILAPVELGGGDLQPHPCSMLKP